MFHYLIFIFCFLSPIKNNIHEHYVSITTAKVNTTHHQLEVSVQLTAHDLEYHFEKNKNIHLHLGSDKENPASDQFISKYIKNHLSFYLDNQIIDLKYLGKETNTDETLWIYMEGDLPEKILPIKVKNDILTQTFENQQNIVHLEGFFKESFTFNDLLKEHIFYK